MTANRIEKQMLDRVKDEFDRREGSVIYDATAPASVEFAELYIPSRCYIETSVLQLRQTVNS